MRETRRCVKTLKQQMKLNGTCKVEVVVSSLSQHGIENWQYWADFLVLQRETVMETHLCQLSVEMLIVPTCPFAWFGLMGGCRTVEENDGLDITDVPIDE
jgi:hypothetical protein